MKLQERNNNAKVTNILPLKTKAKTKNIFNHSTNKYLISVSFSLMTGIIISLLVN